MKRGKHVSFFEIPASKSALTFEPFNIFDRTKALRDQYHQAHLSAKLQRVQGYVLQIKKVGSKQDMDMTPVLL